MWRSIAIALLTGTALASALNLQYLDPIKLQTRQPAPVQQRTALDIINKYLNTERVIVEVDHLLFSDHKDTFSLSILDGKLHIKASTGVAAVWGFNYYLKKYCKSQIEWQTENVQIPEQLPYVKETVIANDRFRYYQNVCTVSYSFVWWKLPSWEKHIQWMALNGINLALVPVAQEAAWARVYRRIGMTQEEIDQYSAGPAFLSWLRMGNVHGWGGPLPQSWHDAQTEIQNFVIEMMVNLGMIHVLPAFNGHVPVAFSRVYPNSTFHNVSKWNGFESEYCCDLFVDPNDPIFKHISKMFFSELNAPSGHIYTSDPFNEITLSEFSTSFVRDTAQAIHASLLEVDNEAVWLVQNWMFVHDPVMWPLNRVQAFLTAVPNGRMLVLDLQSEQWPQYDLYKMYYGQPFIWCMLHNFGGTLGMFGNMVTINRDVYEVRSRVNSTMIGIGLTPEGINQNYVVYDLMLESGWRKSPVTNLEDWIIEYGERRHGCKDTAEAWKYLLKSVYSFNGLNRIRGKYTVTRRPSFRIKPWAWYRSYELFQAFKKMVYVNDSTCTTEGYLYDVADVTRQALQYRADQLYINVANDRYTNTFIFESSMNRFLSALDDMSSILLESDYFRASKWYDSARDMGLDPDDRRLYLLNARNQITLWGPKGEISDYACKQWGELVRDYYRPRWSTFLNGALEAKKAGEIFNEKATRRVVTAIVEIPYVTMSFEQRVVGPQVTVSSLSALKDLAKSLYRKWVYAADVEDLPILIIEADTNKGTSMIDVESDSDETPDSPSVMMFTTPTDD